MAGICSSLTQNNGLVMHQFCRIHSVNTKHMINSLYAIPNTALSYITEPLDLYNRGVFIMSMGFAISSLIVTSLHSIRQRHAIAYGILHDCV